jgi:hypothetical protein
MHACKQMNSSGGVNQECLNSKAVDLQWMCIFADYTLAHIRTPFFISNSMFDRSVWCFLCAALCLFAAVCCKRARGVGGGAAAQHAAAAAGTSIYCVPCSYIWSIVPAGRWKTFSAGSRTMG